MNSIFKKTVVLLFCATILSMSDVCAQKQRGDFQVGVSLGGYLETGSNYFGSFDLDVAANYFVLNNLALRIGTGFRYGIIQLSGGGNFFDFSTIPVYCGVKGYLPLKGRVSLIGIMDAGVSVQSSMFFSDMPLMLHPRAGFSFWTGKKRINSFEVLMGYKKEYNEDYWGIQFGFTF